MHLPRDIAKCSEVPAEEALQKPQERARRAKEGRPPTAGSRREPPARTFMNSSLSKQSVSGPLGRFILLFSIPPAAASQRQNTREAKKQEAELTATAAAATANFHSTGGTASANMAAPAPWPMSGSAAGLRLPPPRGAYDCRSWAARVGSAAAGRRRKALRARACSWRGPAREASGAPSPPHRFHWEKNTTAKKIFKTQASAVR